MKKFVCIQSTKNINVTAGLQSVNMSNKDAHVADRLNVKSAWVGTAVLIKAGKGYYPAEIKDWDSVKALSKDGVLTVGEEVDEVPGDPEETKKVEAVKTKIANEMKKYSNLSKEAKVEQERLRAVKANEIASEQNIKF